MNDNVNVIKEYYDGYDEDNRMSENPLEFLRCKEIIKRYIPSDKALAILDVGGGTGAFSFWLTELGHKVSLIDFTPKHISIAKEHEKKKGLKLSFLEIGDARELPFDDSYFDIVLLMGPLYHLTNISDRIKSLSEAYRVLKPEGRVICEFISRYASLMDGFVFDLVNDPDFIKIMDKDIETGLHIDISKCKRYFTDAYMHHPKEIPLELEKAGFIFEDLIAVTSFGNMIKNVNEKLDDLNFRKILLDTIRKVEKEPSLMGISSHYIGIAKK